MPPRRTFLAASLAGGCAAPPRPSPPLPAGGAIVSAEAWHTDLCLAGQTLAGGALGTLPAVLPGGSSFAFGFGLESWMRAARPGSAEALSALSGGPAVVSIRALSGPVPPGSEDAVALLLPPGGPDAIARFVAGQLLDPPAARPDGGWTLLRSRLRYSLDFTCNSWVMRALAEAGLDVPVQGIRFRGETMAALRAKTQAQG